MYSRKSKNQAQFKTAEPESNIRLTETLSYRDPNDCVAKLVHSELQGLCRIVGDPTSNEASWLNACVAAGDKSLAPRQSFISKTWKGCGTATGAIFSVLTMLLSFAFALFISAQLDSFFFGVDMDTFLATLGGGDGFGLLVSFFAAIAFWVSLLLESKRTSSLLCSMAMVFTALSSIGLGTTFLGTTGGALFALLAVPGIFGVGWLGRLCRESLPKTFDTGKLVRSSIGVLSVPAGLMSMILWLAMYGPRQPGPYTPGNGNTLIVLLVLLGYCVVAPALALARSSQSKSSEACGLLAGLVQAPLVLGILATSLTAGMATVGANLHLGSLDAIWQSAGLAKTLILLGTGVLTASLAVGAGMTGAAFNRLKVTQIQYKGRV